MWPIVRMSDREFGRRMAKQAVMSMTTLARVRLGQLIEIREREARAGRLRTPDRTSYRRKVVELEDLRSIRQWLQREVAYCLDRAVCELTADRN